MDETTVIEDSEENVTLAFILTIAAGLSTAIGSSFVFCSNTSNKKVLASSLALSAGVMMYVSFVEIYFASVTAFEEYYENNDSLASLLATVFFFVGILVCWVIDIVVHRLTGHSNGKRAVSPAVIELQPQVQQQERLEIEIDLDSSNSVKDDDSKLRLERAGVISGIAVGLHNFPEGLATFVATLSDPKLGVSIAIAIAIHNIPEGICVAVPLYYATGSKWKSFAWSLLSGLTEPLGALLGWIILRKVFDDFVFGLLFGLVGGMMIFIVLRELLPTARQYDPEDKLVTAFVVIGMFIMAVSLELFNL